MPPLPPPLSPPPLHGWGGDGPRVRTRAGVMSPLSPASPLFPPKPSTPRERLPHRRKRTTADAGASNLRPEHETIGGGTGALTPPGVAEYIPADAEYTFLNCRDQLGTADLLAMRRRFNCMFLRRRVTTPGCWGVPVPSHALVLLRALALAKPTDAATFL